MSKPEAPSLPPGMARMRDVIRSGYGGADPRCRIVDRREVPTATPIQANPVFGAPAPLPVPRPA